MLATSEMRNNYQHLDEDVKYRKDFTRSVTGMTASTTVSLDRASTLDDEAVKLYYSILSSHKKASVQDIKNRRLISAPAPPLSVLAGNKNRPKTPFFESRESPINKGRITPSLVKYVYLSQSKPCPMDPLKAWRGYNGNLYFEPIQINTLSSKQHATQFPRITTSKSVESKKFCSRASWRDSYQHPAVRFEKESILSSLSMPLTDDYHIADQPIGTLQLTSCPKQEKTQNTRKPHIYKGSMVHRLKKKPEADKDRIHQSAYGYTTVPDDQPTTEKDNLLIASKNHSR